MSHFCYLCLMSAHEKTGNVSHFWALKAGRRWQLCGDFPNRISLWWCQYCNNERVPLFSSLSHPLSLPLATRFFLEKFWVFGTKTHTSLDPMLCVVTDYSLPSFAHHVIQVFPENQRDWPRQSLEAHIMPDHIRPPCHLLFVRFTDTVDKDRVCIVERLIKDRQKNGLLHRMNG